MKNKCECTIKSLHKDDESHISRAEDYCIKHMISYPHHDIKPVWCEECGWLDKYMVTINHRGSAHVKPRND